ncbi:hypothetical protein F5X96DRAFT_242108 [Biscogniauxia mediterranea]|nr:hypothetical protein F5X96DRAFT_242108 [Biscogniauxia mediterranea]
MNQRNTTARSHRIPWFFTSVRQLAVAVIHVISCNSGSLCGTCGDFPRRKESFDGKGFLCVVSLLDHVEGQRTSFVNVISRSTKILPDRFGGINLVPSLSGSLGTSMGGVYERMRGNTWPTVSMSTVSIILLLSPTIPLSSCLTRKLHLATETENDRIITFSYYLTQVPLYLFSLPTPASLRTYVTWKWGVFFFWGDRATPLRDDRQVRATSRLYQIIYPPRPTRNPAAKLLSCPFTC